MGCLIHDDRLEWRIARADKESRTATSFPCHAGHFSTEETNFSNPVYTSRKCGLAQILILHEQEMVSVHGLGVRRIGNHQ